MRGRAQGANESTAHACTHNNRHTHATTITASRRAGDSWHTTRHTTALPHTTHTHTHTHTNCTNTPTGTAETHTQAPVGSIAHASADSSPRNGTGVTG